MSLTDQGFGSMARGKMIYVSEEAHRRLKLLAARQNRPMGRIVEDLIASEMADLAHAWISPEGLLLQQRVLAEVWHDPALDVYNDD